MSGAIAEAKVAPEPKKKNIFVNIAEFEFKFDVPKNFDFSPEALDLNLQHFIKPHFARLLKQLSFEFDDTLEFKVVELEEGSLTIKGVVNILVKATDNALVGGIAAVLLMSSTMTVENDVEASYDQMHEKIDMILEYESKNLELCPVPLNEKGIPVFSPSSESFEMLEFFYCPASFNDVVADVEKVVDDYHDKVNKI